MERALNNSSLKIAKKKVDEKDENLNPRVITLKYFICTFSTKIIRNAKRQENIPKYCWNDKKSVKTISEELSDNRLVKDFKFLKHT